MAMKRGEICIESVITQGKQWEKASDKVSTVFRMIF